MEAAYGLGARHVLSEARTIGLGLEVTDHGGGLVGLDTLSVDHLADGVLADPGALRDLSLRELLADQRKTHTLRVEDDPAGRCAVLACLAAGQLANPPSTRLPTGMHTVARGIWCCIEVVRMCCVGQWSRNAYSRSGAGGVVSPCSPSTAARRPRDGGSADYATPNRCARSAISCRYGGLPS